MPYRYQNINGATIPAQTPFVDIAKIAGFDGTNWFALDVDSNGNIKSRNLVWDVDTLTWINSTGGEANQSNVTNVNASISSVTLLIANPVRKLAIFYNDSSEILYLKLGDTASVTSFTIMIQANSVWTLPLPVYTGQIDAIWSGAVGVCRITELS